MNPRDLRIGQFVTVSGVERNAPITALLRDGAQLSDGDVVAYDEISAAAYHASR